jgi:hypothetical protein
MQDCSHPYLHRDVADLLDFGAAWQRHPPDPNSLHSHENKIFKAHFSLVALACCASSVI